MNEFIGTVIQTAITVQKTADDVRKVSRRTTKLSILGLAGAAACWFVMRGMMTKINGLKTQVSELSACLEQEIEEE